MSWCSKSRPEWVVHPRGPKGENIDRLLHTSPTMVLKRVLFTAMGCTDSKSHTTALSNLDKRNRRRWAGIHNVLQTGDLLFLKHDDNFENPDVWSSVSFVIELKHICPPGKRAKNAIVLLELDPETNVPQLTYPENRLFDTNVDGELVHTEAAVRILGNREYNRKLNYDDLRHYIDEITTAQKKAFRHSGELIHQTFEAFNVFFFTTSEDAENIPEFFPDFFAEDDIRFHDSLWLEPCTYIDLASGIKKTWDEIQIEHVPTIRVEKEEKENDDVMCNVGEPFNIDILMTMIESQKDYIESLASHEGARADTNALHNAYARAIELCNLSIAYHSYYECNQGHTDTITLTQADVLRYRLMLLELLKKDTDVHEETELVSGVTTTSLAGLNLKKPSALETKNVKSKQNLATSNPLLSANPLKQTGIPAPHSVESEQSKPIKSSLISRATSNPLVGLNLKKPSALETKNVKSKQNLASEQSKPLVGMSVKSPNSPSDKLTKHRISKNPTINPLLGTANPLLGLKLKQPFTSSKKSSSK